MRLGPHIEQPGGTGGGAGGSFSAGVSTGGNTLGDTGTVSNQVVLAGGNNITLSQSTGAGGATITISGAAAGGAQTAISGLGNSQTTYTSGTVNLSVNGGLMTIRSTTGQAFQFSVSQSVQAETQTFVGGLGNSQTTYTSGTVNLSVNGGNMTIRSTTGNAFQFSVSQSVQAETQTAISGLGNSQTTYTSGTVSLSELGAITIRSTTGNQFQFSVNAQSVQPETQTFVGGIAGSNTTYTSGTVTFTGVGGGVTVSSNTGQRIDISVAAPVAQTVQTQNLHNVTLSGNTAGAMAQISSGTLTLAGGNNITLSQNGNAVTISGAAAGGAQTFLSGLANSETTYTSGNVTLSALGAITIRSTTGQHFQLSVNAQSVQPETQTFVSGIANSQTTYTSGNITFSELANITIRSTTGQQYQFSVPSGATATGNINAISNSNTTYTSGTIGLSELANITIRSTTGNQFQFSVAGTTGTGNLNAISNSNTTYTSGTIGLSELGAITIRSTTGNQFQFSVNSQTVQTQGVLSVGMSTGGNTQGNTTINTGSRLAFVGTNGITLSQGTAAGATTISISGNAAQTNQSAIRGFGASNTGNTAGNTGISTGIDWVLAGSTNITVSQSTAVGGPNTLWLSAPNAGAGGFGGAGISGGNTSGNTGTVGSQVVFAGGNNITLSGSTNGGSMTITVSAPNLGAGAMSAGVSNLGNTAGSTGITGTQMVLVGSGPVSLSQSTGANGGTVSINAPATSSLSATGAVSISTNGSTISIGVPGPVTFRDYENLPRESLALITNLTATGVTQRPLFLRFSLGGDLTHNIMHVDMSRATSGSNAFTMQAAIYTFVNSTQISRLASLQNVYSNTATASISGIRLFRLQGFETAGSTLSAGDYVMMLYASAANTASMNYSLRGAATVNPPVGMIGSGTNNATTANLHSLGWMPFLGRYTTTTASPPASVGMTQVSEWTSGHHRFYFHLGKT